MRSLLRNLEPEFDYIIIDTPPVLSVTDAALLSALADSTLLVIRAGMTSRVALRRVHDVLAHVDARIMGVILNATGNGHQYGGYYRYPATGKTALRE
jgi:Mrp family chromosome partitioning ATPase